MKKLNLLWVVPLAFVFGALSYSALEEAADDNCIRGLISSSIALDASEKAFYHCSNQSWEANSCFLNERVKRQVELWSKFVG